MKVISLFSGCGGLDLGFKKHGFNIVFANDFDKNVWDTYEKNHGTFIDKRAIQNIPLDEIPDADGIIGGPPCQSWSVAGLMSGINDERGRIFYEYIRILKDKQPLFFVAENVPGIVSTPHINEFNKIINKLENIGYNVNYQSIDARDYGVPQERKRVIIVGYLDKLNKKFQFPPQTHKKEQNKRLNNTKIKKWVTLKEAIGDLDGFACPAFRNTQANELLPIQNHEYRNGGFSYIYMSRNRRRTWDEQSFTIQAAGRQIPLHPSSSKMVKIGKDKFQFTEELNRRFTVRECARIQTFPDDFIFYYSNLDNGYKMIGNAVPIKLAEAIAKQIKNDLKNVKR